MDKTISGVEVTLMLTVVNVGATYFAFRYIDKVGRRKLAIGGYIGMAVFALVAAAGLEYFTATPRIVVVMIGLAGFIASFAIGVGGTGWLLQGEVFPTSVRGQAAATGATVDWLANFALIEVFPVWMGAIGLDWVLVCFAGLCLMAIAVRVPVRAGNQGPFGGGDHPDLRPGGGTGRPGQRCGRLRVVRARTGAGRPGPWVA